MHIKTNSCTNLFGDDHVNAILARQRQTTLLHNLTRSILGIMFHRHDYLCTGRRHQIHRTSHSLHQLSRNHPVGQITVLGHLHCAQHRDVNVTATNHGKAVVRTKVRCARHHGDRFFASIYQISINLNYVHYYYQFKKIFNQTPTSALYGNGPRPKMPFSDCNITLMSLM